MSRRLTKNDIVNLANFKGIKLHKDHPLPSTRREFLASGLMGFAGYLMAPSLLTMATQRVNAQSLAECQALLTPSFGMPGFLHLNLGGGAGNTGQFAVRKVLDASRPLATINNEDNLGYLSNYRSLGLGADANAFTTINNQFANPFPVVANDAATGAQIFARMRELASTACANTASTAICVASQDDTPTNNKFAPQGLLHAVQRAKDLKFRINMNLSNRTGTSLTGVDQDVVGRQSAFAPVVATRLADIERALGVTSAPEVEAGSNVVFSEDEKKAMLKAVNNLSKAQTRRIATAGTGTRANFVELYEQASGKSYCQAIVPQSSVDPYTNTDLQTLWTTEVQGQLNNLSNDPERVKGLASLVYAALNGWAGTVGVDLGGYDYHGNNRATTDGRDSDAGRILGATLRTAEILAKPLFVMVTSDGAVGAQQSNTRFAQWQSDRGLGGCVLLFMYDPRNAIGGAKEGYLVGVDTQVGHFTDGQAAETNTPVGSPERAASAAVHRYLKFSELADWSSLIGTLDPQSGFSVAELNYIAKFGV